MIKDAWYVACRSSEVTGKKIHKTTIANMDIAIFRNASGIPNALLDRCCHRGVPISKGIVQGNEIMCCYHGWCYNGEGKCVRIPELPVGRSISTRAIIPSFPLHEVDGYVWIKINAEQKFRDQGMYFLNEYNNSSFRTTYNTVKEIASDWMHMTENVLDGAHLAYIHKGTLDSKKNKFFWWSKKFREKKADRRNYQYHKTDYGFIAELLDGENKAKAFRFKVYFPSTIMIEMDFGKRKIRVGVHVVPVSPGKCRVEHTFTRNFLKHRMFDFIFKRSALKFLLEDVIVVQYLQPAYEKGGRSWEVSCDNDIVPLTFRRYLVEVYNNYTLPYATPINIHTAAMTELAS